MNIKTREKFSNFLPISDSAMLTEYQKYYQTFPVNVSHVDAEFHKAALFNHLINRVGIQIPQPVILYRGERLDTLPPHIEQIVLDKYALNNVFHLDTLVSASFSPDVAIAFKKGHAVPYINPSGSTDKNNPTKSITCCLLKFKLPPNTKLLAIKNTIDPVGFISDSLQCEEEIVLPFFNGNKLNKFKVIEEQQFVLPWHGQTNDLDFDGTCKKWSPDEPRWYKFIVKTIVPYQGVSPGISPSVSPPSGGKIDLNQAAKYVFQNYLSKPYTDTSYMANWDLKIGGQTINRPNHGLVHTLRTLAYLEPILNFYVQDFPYQQDINFVVDNQDLLKLGLLFYVSGRQNEMGGKEGPGSAEKYRSFKKASAENFRNYCKNVLKLSLNSPIVTAISNALLPRGFQNPNQCVALPNQPPNNFPAKFCHVFNIMILCHNMDLLRVFSKSEYNPEFVVGKKLMTHPHYDLIIELVIDCICETGDSLAYGWASGCSGYDLNIFPRASTDVDYCQDILDQVTSRWKQENNVVINI